MAKHRLQPNPHLLLLLLLCHCVAAASCCRHEPHHSFLHTCPCCQGPARDQQDRDVCGHGGLPAAAAGPAGAQVGGVEAACRQQGAGLLRPGCCNRAVWQDQQVVSSHAAIGPQDRSCHGHDQTCPLLQLHTQCSVVSTATMVQHIYRTQG